MTIGTSLADVATLLLVTCWFRVAAAARTKLQQIQSTH